MKKIIGIGNALTDYLVNLESNQVLVDYQLPKGSMSLVDAEYQKGIEQYTAGLPHTLSLGGSAANTIRTLAKLGTPSGFIGKVGDDTTGRFFAAALENLKIHPTIYRGTQRSGKCVSLISPDGERTMLTHLGAALELTDEEIEPSVFDNFDILYVEGYLVQNYTLIEGIMKKAKSKGLKIAIDLASFNVVFENLEFLKRIVPQYVDIIFANEHEAAAYTGEKEPVNALQSLSEVCEIAVVKIGMKGALIKEGGRVMHVGIMEAAQRVDTTGAGDFYAAGFLYGLCDGLNLCQCGTIGAITAGKAIEVVGTTLGEESWVDIFRLVGLVKTKDYHF